MDEFDEWAANLGILSVEVKVRMRRVFDEHGPVSREQLDRIWRDDQLVLARVAVRLVGDDIAATTAREAPPFEYRDEEGGIRISYCGQYATSPIVGITQTEVTVEVADFMQDEVMEDVRGVWPECRRHHAGLHPTLTARGPEWLCRVGGHAVAAIGELS